MKRSRWLFMVAAFSALSLVAAACGGDDGGDDVAAPGDEECTWQIGTIGALSGDYATVGKPILAGIRYGVEQMNEQGDLPCELELVEKDSQGDPSQAPPLAQDLVQEENLVAIVGPYFSGETDATGDIYEEAGVPFLCPSCTNPELSKNGWTNFFRLVGTDEQQGEEAGNYLAEVAGAQSVVIMHDNSEYGKPLADKVAETLGGAAVANIAINPEETDHSAEISKAKDRNPDAIFFGGYQPEFSEIIKQGTDAGLDVLYTSGDGSKAPELAQDASAQGAVVFCPCDDPNASQNPEAQQWAQDFESATGKPPGTYAVEGYDGIALVVEALTQGGYGADTDTQEIREGIRQWVSENTFEGLSKSYSFDETGEIGQVSIFAYEVADQGFDQLGLVSELLGG